MLLIRNIDTTTTPKWETGGGGGGGVGEIKRNYIFDGRERKGLAIPPPPPPSPSSLHFHCTGLLRPLRRGEGGRREREDAVFNRFGVTFHQLRCLKEGKGVIIARKNGHKLNSVLSIPQS